MFSKKQKETNYWMSYADILTGLAIIFIIISLILGKKYSDCNGGSNKVTKKQLEQIKKINSTFKTIGEKTSLFEFDEESNLFRLKYIPQFEAGKEEIPNSEEKRLIKAGKELEIFIKRLHNKVDDVEFAIIIEGRTAKFLNKGSRSENNKANKRNADVNKRRSYGRALNLQKLWYKKGLIKDLDYCDVLVVGNGFDGKGRFPYKPGQEERNKSFVIKIIPKFNQIKKEN